MATKENPSVSALKVTVAGFGAIVFLVASVVVAFVARRYQLSGQPMPNGKGGFMTFGDGYWIALVLFLFSVVWFITARRFWRSR
jgi:hypothetical protein